jgi:site-specific recombinase XerD
MKTTDFAEHMATFLTMYLPGQRGFSENTVMSYRDTFKLILIFAEEKMNISADRITLSKFNSDFIEAFVEWLETERKCSRATRNQRLSAIHAFVKYVRKKKPEYLFESLKILDIHSKRKVESGMPYLTPDILKDILEQPNVSDKYGRRDLTLLSLLYDSGARVQELCDLRVRDVRIKKPYTVTLTGKINKTRSVPIMAETVNLLEKYLAENRLATPDKLDYPLFVNHQRTKLTRAGVTYIIKKYGNTAREKNPLIPKISPHIFRHSKAMHMLQAGINLIYIRDFLGHAHVETTEIYAKADTEMKRIAIEKTQIRIDPELPDWAQDTSLMAMLTNICGSNQLELLF